LHSLEQWQKLPYDKEEIKSTNVNVTIKFHSSMLIVLLKTILRFKVFFYPFFIILKPAQREEILYWLVRRLVKFEVIS
jgi:hypothetical protein